MAAKKKTAVQDEQVLDVEITGETEEAIVEETVAELDAHKMENGEYDLTNMDPIDAYRLLKQVGEDNVTVKLSPESAKEPEPEPSEEEETVEAPVEEVIIKRLPRHKNNPAMFRKYLMNKKFARR